VEVRGVWGEKEVAAESQVVKVERNIVPALGMYENA
jgi:hypothetical protein